MILSFDQIKDIILENPGLARVNKGHQYSEKLCRHIRGKGMDSYFKNVDGFERKAITSLRNEYAKSNVDLFARLSRPLDKIFTARGGSLYFNLPEAKEKQARQLAQDVCDGHSVRKWVENFWLPHMLDDPFGIVFLELAPQAEAIRLKQAGLSYVLPTYKAISTIYDYLPKGNRLEWVVFLVSDSEKKRVGAAKDEKLYRLVDDAMDYYIRVKDREVSVVAEESFPNYFGEVPGMVNSDIVDPAFDNCFLSLFDPIIELAENFLRTGSIKTINDFMHGFPKYAEFADDCATCKGHGQYEGKDCEECGGSGKRVMITPSSVKLLNWPTKEEQVILPTQAGGYISPDKTFYEIATSDLAALEDLMTVTLWGTQSKLKTPGMSADSAGQVKTATEVVDEMKPQADRLVPISEMAEQRHKFILDAIIRLQVSPGYKGASVNYGRRYLLESPDAIWLKYSDARTKGSPQNVMDSLLNEYIDANYQADPVGLAVAKKLMYVEPFVHITAQILKGLAPDPADYAAKLYFSEWLATISEGALLAMSVEELKTALYDYAKAKKLPEPQPAQPVAA